MLITIDSAQNQGKTTLVNDFLKQWPNYKKSAETHRTLQVPLNKNATPESQWEILLALVTDVEAPTKNEYVIYDRSCLSWLAYSLWAVDKKLPGFDKEYIDKAIPLIQKAMRKVDVIFFLPITAAAPIPIEPRKGRDIDPGFIEEIDNILKAISYLLMVKGECPFFDKENRPPIIEIVGDRQQRIELMKLYINPEGNPIDDGKSVLDAESLDIMAALVREQNSALENETQAKKQINRIISDSASIGKYKK